LDNGLGPIERTMNAVLQRVRTVCDDQTIERFVDMRGRPILEFGGLSDKFVALAFEEHFYWPFVARGYEHDVSDLVDLPMKLVDVWDSPRILEVQNFITEAEADIIIDLARARGLDQSSTVPRINEDYEYDPNVRTSTNTFLDYYSHPLLHTIAIRAGNLTGIPAHHSEDLQVVHYEPGQHYWAHTDSFDIEDVPSTWEDWMSFQKGYIHDNRYVTLLLYLNDVEEGGETVFPKTNPDWNEDTDGFGPVVCANNYPAIRVKPKKGKAVIFYDLLEDRQLTGQVDPRSLHGGCDPVVGEKWAANFWIHTWPYRSESDMKA